MNEELVDNLIPIWTGRELDKHEIIEMVEETEGDNAKGRIFMGANKNTVILVLDFHVNLEHQQIRGSRTSGMLKCNQY